MSIFDLSNRYHTGEVITDCRIGNAILRKMARDNGIEPGAYMHRDYKYVNEPNHDKKYDLSFCECEYKGAKFKVSYLSGCFNPFLVRI